jgi:uncharacterized protein (DUF427 family)
MSTSALSELKSEFSATASRLNALSKKLSESGPHRMETTSRRVRVLFNKKIIADTSSSKFVWEHPYYPTYYLPSSDVQTKYIEKLQKTEDGDGHICRLVVGDRGAGNILWLEKGKLEGLIRFEFREMGIFLEEL